MRLVESNIVAGIGAGVGALTDLLADLDAARHADNGDAEAVAGASGDGLVDITRIEREEGAKDNDDLTGAVARGVVKLGAGHLEGVLEGGVALRFSWGISGIDGVAERLNGSDVVSRVAGEVGD